MIRHPPKSTLFPSPTLFRSHRCQTHSHPRRDLPPLHHPWQRNGQVIEHVARSIRQSVRNQDKTMRRNILPLTALLLTSTITCLEWAQDASANDWDWRALGPFPVGV